jgi:ketosteroid isomerase-like protein
MRLNSFAAVVVSILGLSACGGEEPAPQAPPPAPPPAATTSATAATTVEPAPAPAPATKPTQAELIVQSLKGIGEAFEAHDAKKLASYYAEDCVVLGFGEPDAHGRVDVEKALQGLFDTFGDAKSAPTRVWMKGNVVITEIAWAGTMTADFMGVKASKKPTGEMRAHVMWFNDDGLVKEVHQYADGAGMMAQLEGKPKAPPVPMLPTNPPDVHTAKGTPDEDKLVEWVKTVDDAFNKDDTKDALTVIADDADEWLNFSGKPAMKGKKEAAKGLDGWFKAFPDQKWTTTNAWGIDGFVIAEQTMAGTQKGRLGPLPPSNKEVTWHWLEIWQPNAEGKIEHGWDYANLIEVMAQTGALKFPHDSTSKVSADKAAPSKSGASTDTGAIKK